MALRKPRTGAIKSPPLVPVERRSFWSAFSHQRPDVAIHTDEFVKIFIKEGWGIQELETSVVADIDVGDLERDRSAVQRRMKLYFDDEIDIFYTESKSPRERDREQRLHDKILEEEVNEFPLLPKRHPLNQAYRVAVGISVLTLTAVLGVIIFAAIEMRLYGVIPSAIAAFFAILITGQVCRHLLIVAATRSWPGFMEERLALTIEERFPSDDHEIRRVIDRFAELFLTNNWMYARLKRLLQALAIISFHIAAAPLVIMALTGNLWTFGVAGVGIAIGWALIVALIALWTFHGMTDHIYRDKYYQSLQNSAQDVSNVIRDRMSAINQLYQHTLTHIADVHAVGERYTEGTLEHVEDVELKNGNSFFNAQKLIWLAKRLEHIELYLQARLHSAHTIHSATVATGYVANTCFMILGCLPAAALAFHAAVITPQALGAGDYQSALAGAPILGAAICVALLTIFVSIQSFYNRKWNSLKTDGGSTILEDYFNPKVLNGWQTYRKRQLDVNIGGRFQKAMFRIQQYFEKMGRTG